MKQQHRITSIVLRVLIPGVALFSFTAHAQWQEPQLSPPQGLPPGFVWLQGTSPVLQEGRISVRDAGEFGAGISIVNRTDSSTVTISPDATYSFIDSDTMWHVVRAQRANNADGGLYVLGGRLLLHSNDLASPLGIIQAATDLQLYAGSQLALRATVDGSVQVSRLCIQGDCRTAWPASGSAGTFVALQATSPGTADTGNFTITGTGRTGKMELVGDGTGSQANFNAPVRDVYMDVHGNIHIRLDADNNGTTPHEFRIVNGDNTATVFRVDEEGTVALQKDLLASGDVRGARLCIGADCRTSWGGGGTVTSVGLSMPSPMFAVSDSPVTGSGTLIATWNSQNPNLVLAGPSSGTAAAPAFRNLVANDIPNIDAAKMTSGSLDAARIPDVISHAVTVQSPPGAANFNQGILKVYSDAHTADDVLFSIMNLVGGFGRLFSVDAEGDVWLKGGLSAGGSGAQIVDTTGKIPGISSASFTDLNGSALTSLNASSIASGTIGDARLSSNVALLDRSPQVFTGTNKWSVPSSGAGVLQGAVTIAPSSGATGIPANNTVFGIALGTDNTVTGIEENMRLRISEEGDIFHGSFDNVFNLRGAKNVAINIDEDDALDGSENDHAFAVRDGRGNILLQTLEMGAALIASRVGTFVGPWLTVQGGADVTSNVSLRLFDAGTAASNENILQFAHANSTTAVPVARIRSVNPALNAATGAHLILETAPNNTPTFNANQLFLKNDGKVGIGGDPTGAEKLQVSGDASVTGNLMIGREKNVLSCSIVAGVTTDCDALCTSGFKILGGGCSASNMGSHNVELWKSVPRTGDDGWSCGVINGGATSLQLTSYAICARLAP